LRQVRILPSLNDQQFARLAAQCTWSAYDGVTEVLIQNTPCDQFYFVCSGRVHAKTFSDAGKEITFAELASRTNTTRESVTRALNRLKKMT
jgi:CRP-like cAMP-binding protein